MREQSTGNLTTAKRNIAETLVKIESIHENFRVASQTENVISAGLKVEDPTDFYRVSEGLLRAGLALLFSDDPALSGRSGRRTDHRGAEIPEGACGPQEHRGLDQDAGTAAEAGYDSLPDGIRAAAAVDRQDHHQARRHVSGTTHTFSVLFCSFDSGA